MAPAPDARAELSRREFLERGFKVTGSAWAMPVVASFAVAGSSGDGQVELTPVGGTIGETSNPADVQS